MDQLGQPGEHGAEHDRDQSAGQPKGQAHAGQPADQHDGQRQHEQPRIFPAEKCRAHRDEGDRDAGEGAEHRGARRVFAHGRSDERAQQHDGADHQAPDQPRSPGQQRVMRLQVDRQHDQKDDDEHVRHARPIGHRRHRVAPLAFGEPPGEIGVIEIAQGQGDAERRQDPAIDDVGRQVDHVQAQSGQHDHVQHDVGEQAEKAVPIAGNPPARQIGGSLHRIPPDPPVAGSAAITALDEATQPKIPPCALIMRNPISWNSGKYEPTQSSTTTHS